MRRGSHSGKRQGWQEEVVGKRKDFLGERKILWDEIGRERIKRRKRRGVDGEQNINGKRKETVGAIGMAGGST